MARYKSDFILYFAGDQLSCIIELLGMPPQKLLDQSKRAKNFISSKGKAVLRILNEMTKAPLQATPGTAPPPLSQTAPPSSMAGGQGEASLAVRQALGSSRLRSRAVTILSS